MNGITKFLLNLILPFIVIGVSGVIFLKLFKNMSNELVPQPPQSVFSVPTVQPIIATPIQAPQQPIITAPPPAMTKTTTSHRLGKICNTKKCIYQVEIVETTCYNGYGGTQCKVTHKSKGTETEILTP